MTPPRSSSRTTADDRSRPTKPRSRRSAPPLRGPAAPVLERLFAEKGLEPGDWWPFLVQGEGTDLPGGIESLSGFVLDRKGRVFGWWLGWDEEARRHTLDRWWEVESPEREFAGDEEFRRAGQALR